MKRDEPLLRHMLDCITHIESLFSREQDPLSDRTLRDAVLRNLQTLAESGTRLSPDFHQRHLEVDWVALRSFRNHLVHDYLGIDMRVLRRALATALPILKRAVISDLPP
jgi:uncharacterized protein with HEPN domain